ncbi:MAG: efflux RND transporter periplasmic adaptor subunit [Planctomycetaceae bacterium]|nr:efflux RND transporter periplasmic adaptor subunit [Planctomycetaceae bacterium]
MKKKILPAIVMTLVVLVGSTTMYLMWKRSLKREDPEAVATAEDGAEETGGSHIHVSDVKRDTMNLGTTTAQRLVVQPARVVPGRLQYDDRRHIEIRAATPGIVTAIHVRPGETVEAGTLLLELSSPEIGQARADVLKCAAELSLATEQQDWHVTTCRGIEQLNEAVSKRLPLAEIRRTFRTVTLGESRDSVLTTYSQLLLAESLLASAEQNAASGVIPERVVQERTSERDSAEATLTGTLEQLLFDARRRCRQAETEVADAQRRLRIARHHVNTLLGKLSSDEDNHPDGTNEAEADQLSIVEVRAPFAGTIERRNYSVSERVEVGNSLFVLADTSTLWVAADLREREWTALGLQAGDPLEVFLPGEPSKPISAKVYFVGREVDIDSNAVPLVAEIQNADGHLRPGMYVTVKVPVSSAREILSVPEGAVLEHDQQEFVFVPGSEGEFRRVNVQTGVRCDQQVEILTGLNEGEVVVCSNAFFLKSELLLEGEEE